MFRTGRSNIIYSSTITWSAGATSSTKSFNVSVPSSAGLTTLAHEIQFNTSFTAPITASVFIVSTIGGSAINLTHANATITISGLQTVNGATVSGISTKMNGLFNNGTLLINCSVTATTTATVSVNCIIQELEGII